MSTVASTNCAGCLEAIADKCLKCCLCKQNYDLLCANVSEAYYNTSMTIKHRNTWRCQMCRCQEPKTDNSNTPVRTASAVFDDSLIQLEGRSYGEVAAAPIDHDDSVETSTCVYPDRSMSDNITLRHERPRATTSVFSKFQGSDTLNEDMLYLDNVRSIVREELALSADERMANVVCDAVSEKILSPLHSAINTLLDRVHILEGIVTKLYTSSLASCGEPNCPSRIPTPQNLPVGTDQVKPLMREYEKHLAVEFDLKIPSPLQQNIASDRPPVLPRGRGSGVTTTTVKSCEPVVNRKLSVALASDTNSLIQNPIKDNSGNLTHTGKGRDASDESDDWTEVKRKRTRNVMGRATRGSAVAGSTQLEASEWLRRIHLFYVKQGTTDDQVKSHLKSITGSEGIKVESLKSRGPYASFKLTVPTTLYNQVMASESWPLNVCVKPWSQSFRRRDEKKT